MLRSGNALNILLLVAVVICALSLVTSRHKARKLYVELQTEKELAQRMEVEWGQLQLEQSTWATPARIEKIAAQQLGMQMPKNGQVKFVKLNQLLHYSVTKPSSSVDWEGAVMGRVKTGVNGEQPQR